MNGSEGNPNFIIVNLLQKSGRDTAVPFVLKLTVIVPRQIDPLIEVEENVQRARHGTYSRADCWRVPARMRSNQDLRTLRRIEHPSTRFAADDGNCR